MRLLFSVIIFMFMCGCCVDFPDPVLRSYMEEYFDKNAGECITPDEMKAVTDVVIANPAISNLEGLQFAVNLSRFVLPVHSSVISISQLNASIYLRWVTLSFNSIHDMSPLANDTFMQEFNCLNCGINDIGFLQNWQFPLMIFMDSNNITNLYPLTLTNYTSPLTQIGVRNNPLSDISCDIYIPQLQLKGYIVYQNTCGY